MIEHPYQVTSTVFPLSSLVNKDYHEQNMPQYLFHQILMKAGYLFLHLNKPSHNFWELRANQLRQRHEDY